MAKQSENPVLNVRVRTLEREIPALRTDVKEVHAIVTRVEIALASAPSKAQLEDQEQRIRALEDDKNRTAGGLKVLIGACSALSACIAALIGWAISLFSK